MHLDLEGPTSTVASVSLIMSATERKWGPSSIVSVIYVCKSVNGLTDYPFSGVSVSHISNKICDNRSIFWC